jgi:hypothetical protein
MRATAVILMLYVSALAPAVADAATTAYAAGQGSPNSVVVSIPLHASVTGACGFGSGNTPSGSYDVPDLTAAYTHDFTFEIACNTPSRVAVVSSNGGLKTSLVAPAGYANSADYTVALTLTADDATTATGSCLASTLTSGGACSFTGPSSSSAGLRLGSVSHNAGGTVLTVSAPPYSVPSALIASTGYADTLTITISPTT